MLQDSIISVWWLKIIASKLQPWYATLRYDLNGEEDTIPVQWFRQFSTHDTFSPNISIQPKGFPPLILPTANCTLVMVWIQRSSINIIMPIIFSHWLKMHRKASAHRPSGANQFCKKFSHVFLVKSTLEELCFVDFRFNSILTAASGIYLTHRHNALYRF